MCLENLRFPITKWDLARVDEEVRVDIKVETVALRVVGARGLELGSVTHVADQQHSERFLLTGMVLNLCPTQTAVWRTAISISSRSLVVRVGAEAQTLSAIVVEGVVVAVVAR